MPVDPAFDLAASAAASGNTPVGCVITIEGRIVAEAEEHLPPGATHSRAPRFLLSWQLYEP